MRFAGELPRARGGGGRVGSRRERPMTGRGEDTERVSLGSDIACSTMGILCSVILLP